MSRRILEWSKAAWQVTEIMSLCSENWGKGPSKLANGGLALSMLAGWDGVGSFCCEPLAHMWTDLICIFPEPKRPNQTKEIANATPRAPPKSPPKKNAAADALHAARNDLCDHSRTPRVPEFPQSRIASYIKYSQWDDRSKRLACRNEQLQQQHFSNSHHTSPKHESPDPDSP